MTIIQNKTILFIKKNKFPPNFDYYFQIKVLTLVYKCDY